MQGADAVCTLSERGAGWAVHYGEVGRMRGFTRALVGERGLGHDRGCVQQRQHQRRRRHVRQRGNARRHLLLRELRADLPHPSEQLRVVRVTGVRRALHEAHDLRLQHRCPDPGAGGIGHALVRRSGVHDRDQERLDLPQRRAGDRAVLRGRMELRRGLHERLHPEHVLPADRGLRRPEPVGLQERHHERDERSCGDRRNDLHRDPEGAVQPVPHDARVRRVQPAAEGVLRRPRRLQRGSPSATVPT